MVKLKYWSILFAGILSLATGAACKALFYQNPVIPGDHPDPSIIRAGNVFWAVSTSSEWGPIFQLQRSTDLVNWEVEGAVLPHRPDWASGKFWAPEISEFNGKFFVYYAAAMNGGPLAVAVASADRPEGPYHDYGPIVHQDDGSIDPAPATDEHGQRYLIWKEDGNSRDLPSTIWAQPLQADGIHLSGHPTALIVSDVAWEGKVVEGPFILRRGDWFYLFYSGSGCCGRGCKYAMGVARSRALLGPWEKNPANPILAGNNAWRCPGHGSIVADQRGRYWLLYHGYSNNGFVFTGRQALLDEVIFDGDGWPSINHGNGPSADYPSPFGKAQVRESGFADNFTGSKISAVWQWPQDNEPGCRVQNGVLELKPSDPSDSSINAAFLGLLISKPDFTATVAVAAGDAAGFSGITVCGDAANSVGLSVGKTRAILWRMKHGHYRKLSSGDLPPTSSFRRVRVVSRGGNHFDFAVADARGNWKNVGSPIDESELPPWDRGLRVGMATGGEFKAIGHFRNFKLIEASTTQR
jgi:beta-xylosidase